MSENEKDSTASLAQVSSIQRQVQTLAVNCIKVGFPLSTIPGYVREQLMSRKSTAKLARLLNGQIEEMAEEAVQSNSQLEYYKKLYESTFYHNYLTNDVIQFHAPTRSYDTHKLANLKQLVNGSDHSFSLESENKIVKCQFEYNPHRSQLEWEDNNTTFFNTYRPPDWRADNFYLGTPIEESVLPPLIEKFLQHLTDCHAGSVEYILDWASLSIQDRARCYLVAVGNEGVGKGTLFNILKHLHMSKSGSQKLNVTEDAGGRGADRFNSHYMNTTLIYLNEITEFNEPQQNAIKKLADDDMQFEGKGKDATNARNYASIYFTSNNLGAIPVSSSDRRYSVIELTDKRLDTAFTADEMNQLNGSNHDMLDEFARYCYHRKVDKVKMLVPFASKRKEQLREAALTDWRAYVIEEWVPTAEPIFHKYNSIKNEIRERARARHRINKQLFKEFAKSYPQHIEISYDDQRNLSYKPINGKTKEGSND